MGTHEPILRARHLTRVFGDGDEEVVAVNDVSLDLFPREIALLMGPSGSGKSTLVAVLSGLLRPTSGQVQILGEELWALSERGRQRFRLEHFGFIFQGFNLFPGLTARQQLEIVLRWGRGLSQRQACQRARELLGALGLQEHAARIPEQLSGGEKQRVAVARALVKAPNVCFADEPTSALDWEHGRQVVELLREAAHTRNAAVLIVAHDARLIPYADRLYYLEDGRLCDASAQLSSAPAAPALSIQNLQEACHERLHHP